MKPGARDGASSSDAEVRLVINGGPLSNPNVGVGVYALRLIRGLLDRMDSFPFRVALDETLIPNFPEIPSGLFAPVRRGRSLGHPMPDEIARANRTVALTIRRFPQAVFHSPGPLWSWHRPAKTVVTLHDCISRHFPLYLGKFWIRKRIARASERYAAASDLVLTDSECSARDLAMTLGIAAKKIRVLYPWLGPEFASQECCASEADRVRAMFTLPKRFWLYIGGYDYRKNVERLIEAYALARQSADCPPLVLAGKIPSRTKPPYSDVPGSITRLALSKGQVLMPGFIPEENLPGLYAAAELFIYPSLYEGFGLPPAEAIAAGTPVLVSGTSSLPEVVRNPACLFNPESVVDMASKLTAAAANPEVFRCSLPEEFTDRVAIPRYLELISLL